MSMNIQTVLEQWSGSAEDVECLRQFARDYSWEGPIEDAEVIAALERDAHPDAIRTLKAALETSAEREQVSK